MVAWVLSGSSGRGSLECVRVASVEGTGLVLCAVSVHGLLWDRRVQLSVADLVCEYEVRLPQVVISREALRDFACALDAWAPGQSIGSIDLAVGAGAGQKAHIRVGPFDGLLTRSDKPACVVELGSDSVMAAQCAFLVDETCLRMCAEEIRSFLGKCSR